MRLELYRGVYTRVAKDLDVSISIVARVGKGLKRSKRIEAALQGEAQRIERLIEKVVREAA